MLLCTQVCTHFTFFNHSNILAQNPACLLEDYKIGGSEGSITSTYPKPDDIKEEAQECM